MFRHIRKVDVEKCKIDKRNSFNISDQRYPIQRVLLCPLSETVSYRHMDHFYKYQYGRKFLLRADGPTARWIERQQQNDLIWNTISRISVITYLHCVNTVKTPKKILLKEVQADSESWSNESNTNSDLLGMILRVKLLGWNLTRHYCIRFPMTSC